MTDGNEEFLPVKKLRVREEEEFTKVICSMNVATGEGAFFPKFSLMYVESTGTYYTVQHEKGVIPTPTSLKLGLVQDYARFSCMAVENEIVWIISGAMLEHKERRGYHICPFTFLVAYCLGKGLDLFEEGILEI